MPVKTLLSILAQQPASRTRVGQVPVHGQVLRDLLRAIPREYTAELSPDGTRLLIAWHTDQRRGALSMRALARPKLGPRVLEALAEVRAARGRPGWCVRYLPKELFAAVRPIFGSKKYANHSAEQAADMIVAWGWRDF